MTSSPSTAIVASLVVTAVITLAWAVWGVREYRRTGRAQWLWMAALLGVSLLVMISTYAR